MRSMLQLFEKSKLQVLLLVMFLLAGHIATATIRYVKPGASGTGASWGNASGDLQAMITASAVGDEIWVVKGTYLPTRLATTGAVSVNNRTDAFVLKAGVNIYGGFLGAEIFRTSRNYTSNVTTLSGDIGTAITKTDNCFHVVIAAGPLSGDGLLDGFTITNGYADAATAVTVNAQANAVVNNRGGGVYITNASPAIQNCIITRNEALNGIGGAGIFSGSAASPTINNCNVNTNSTTGTTSNGAGMYIASSATAITNCTISSNNASGEGGGIYIASTGVVAVSDDDFTSNTATSNGGGIANYSSSVSIVSCDFTTNNGSFGGGLFNRNASPVVSTCNFSSNTTGFTGGGGGIFNSTSSSPTITKCTFSENSAWSGGGMSNYTASAPTINNCRFLGNVSTGGGNAGGLENNNSSPAISNCIFSGNRTYNGFGGAMSNYLSSPVISNCTIAGNNSNGDGGGIYNLNSSLPAIKNCIIYGNTAGISTPSSFNNTTAVVSYSDVEGGYIGTGNINIDPLFISLQPASAAPTTIGNYRLQSCSPAINIGNNTGVTATDLDGNPRIINTTVDMGAYEKQLPLPDAAGIVYVDASKNGNGKTWATAVSELADALKAAKTNTAITQIWVAKGTYYPLFDAATLGCSPADNRDKSFVLVNNVKIYGGFAGGETTTAGRNFATNETILSGDIGVGNNNTDNCYHVVIGSGALGIAALDGFTVTRGNANGATLDFSTVNGNIIYKTYGGGMENQSSSSPILTNCTFSGNSAELGGGMMNNTSCSPAITNCTFSENSASSGGGGGMYNNISSSPPLINCSFLGNTTTNFGGGMYNSTSSPSLINCTFSGNKANRGGGIHNINTSTPTLTNCTFAGNSAATFGGGIYNASSAPVINNSIIWGNTAATTNSIYPTAGSSVTNSIVEGGYPGAINANPLFINPQPASAAPTTLGDYRLQSCSPAINQGNNASVPGGVTTDLDGNPRFVYTTIDMGAYEVQSSFVFTITPTAGIVYVDKTKSGNGSSWSDAVTELADALKAAKYNAAITQIWVAKGTYYPLYDAATMSCSSTDNRERSFVLVNNVKVYGGFAGGETTITGRNFISNETTLSGDIGIINNKLDNCYHVLISADAVGTAELNGFTISNGYATGTSVGIIVNTRNIARDFGGGIYLEHSSPRIINCIFSGNSAPGDSGGGMSAFFSASVISNCAFIGNTALGGGGIINNQSPTSISNCTFSGNVGIVQGGAIVGSPATISNCIIWGNKANTGNAIDPASGSTVTNCIIQGGYATGTNIINKDPGFLSPQPSVLAPTTSGDYRLHPCSPAVNAGNNVYITEANDLDGNIRIVNTTVDLGAYELQAGATVNVVPSSNIVYVDSSMYGNGSSWLAPLHNMADALKAAKTNSAIQQIWIKKGTYYPLYDAATLGCFPADNRDKSFVLVNNVKVYGGFAGGETSTAGRNFITNETILSADMGVTNNITDNCYHVVVSAGVVGTATLDGFTITKGNANGAGNITVNGNISDRVRGAGITNLASSPAISNCVVSSNTASGGAAIGNITSAPVLSNCTFSSNTASNSGGVIDNYLNSAISITNCLFSGNTAGFGGAIMNSGGSSLTMKNSMLSGNTATDGGAFYNQAATTANIINCVFKGNKASNGAALYINNSSPQINNCTIAANLASANAGGILNNNASPAITNSIIWANKAASNNNISVLSGIPVITNSIIEGGFATGTNIINSDPLFLSPQPATSAPTTLGDYHVQACSPAINYGDNSTVTALTDLDANTRIKFTDVDLGAYEVQTQDLTQSTWRGINTNWNDKVNWCGGYVPLATTDISIPSGLTNYPTTALTNSVKNISLANNTSVTVSSTGSLSINGTYSNTGSTITNNGNWIMAGSSAGQSFPGSSATVAAMNNLEINNSSGITFNKSFSITGSLIPTAGNINVNNVDITLKSSASATASVAIIQPAASITHTGTGSFIVERFINTGTNTAIGQHAKSWQFLATPVNGQTIFQSWQEGGSTPAGFGTIVTGTGTGFDITTVLPSLKFFNDNANSWTGVTNTGNTLQNKNGYMLYVRGDRTVTTSAGAPNNTTLRSKGTIFTTTNPPPIVIVQANKFQAVGNPYASRIAFSRLRSASTGINDVFYVWDPKIPGNYQSGSYQTLTGITGYAPTVGAANTNYPAGVPSPNIESGQAFFVRGNGTGGNVNFNEGIKETGNRLVSRNDSDALVQRQFLYASLYSNGMIADGNIIAFDEGFGNEVNDLDAYKLLNSGENFGLRRNDMILAVEAHEPVNVYDTLFYHLQNLRQQTYQLRFAPVNMDAVGLPAFLIDRFSGNIFNISLQDSSFVDFIVTGDSASASPSRFMIVFSLQGPVPVTLTSVKGYWKQNNVNIEWHVENETNIVSYDVERSSTGTSFMNIGSVAAGNTNNPTTRNYLFTDTNPFENNFYRIRITGLNNDIKYSNIINVKKNKTNNGISIYPNPLTDANLPIWFTGMPAGMYRINMFNASGQSIFNTQLKYDGNSLMTNVKLAQMFPHGNYNVEVNGPQNSKFIIPVTY